MKIMLETSQDSEYMFIKGLYDNYEVFKDREAESAKIRDLLDKLEGSEICHHVYTHTADNGCTIFYDN